jgi:hypothetical protein
MGLQTVAYAKRLQPQRLPQTALIAGARGRANENLRRGDQAEQRACAAPECGEQAAIFVSSTPSATSGAQSALRFFQCYGLGNQRAWEPGLACQPQNATYVRRRGLIAALALRWDFRQGNFDM